MTSTDEIEFSVLLPLQEARATGDECVEAWVGAQTFPRQRYEVVFLAPGVDGGLERRVRARLGLYDRWVEHPMRNEYELFNVGAKHARGRFLIFTEAHCVPDPECLAAMHDYLRATGQVGARGRTIGEAANPLGVLEHTVYDEGLRIGEELGHWDKVLIHSLAIRSDVFHEVGGFEPGYGDFSPQALSIALWQRGYRLGFTPASAVRHTYTGELGILVQHLRDYGRGEMAFRAQEGATVAARYLEEAWEWTDRWAHTRSGARAGLRAAVASPRLELGWLRVVLGYAAMRALGPRARLWMSVLRLGLARLGVKLDRAPARRLRRYRLLWDTAAQHGRIEWLAAHPPADPPPLPNRLTYDLTTADAPHLIGFGIREHWEGRPFRWSGPVGLIAVSLPPGANLEARLATLPIRPSDPPLDLRIAVDGVLIPPDSYRIEPEAVFFRVLGAGAQWLSFACASLRPRRRGPGDSRHLGLPVRTLEFRPA